MALLVTVQRVDDGHTVDSGAFQSFDASARMPLQCIIRENGPEGVTATILKEFLDLARRGLADEAVSTLATNDTLAAAVAKAYVALG